jgi:hypothetical protein
MVNAARASFTLRACLWQGRRAHLRAAAAPSPNQSLAKHNRKPSQLTENKHQRSKSIASFCRNLLAPPPHPTHHDSRATYRASRFTNHQSLLTNHAFLIASRQLLEIELTRSQQTRKHFLIGSFSGISAPAPRLHNGRRKFLTATHRIQKIANHMKRNEKRFSNRNTESHRSIGNPACAHLIWFDGVRNATIQNRRAQAGLPMPRVLILFFRVLRSGQGRFRRGRLPPRSPLLRIWGRFDLC